MKKTERTANQAHFDKLLDKPAFMTSVRDS